MVAMATSKRRIRGSSLTFHTYAYTFKSFVGAARTDYLETSEGYLVDLWGSELFSEWDWEKKLIKQGEGTESTRLIKEFLEASVA
jgi:hypothetical protein